MKRRALLFQFHFHDFLSVVPRATSIRHEDRLEQAEQRDRHQVANEEVGLDERKSERGEEYREEDIEHPSLGILSADLYHFLAVADRCRPFTVESDVRLDELDRSIGTGC